MRSIQSALPRLVSVLLLASVLITSSGCWLINGDSDRSQTGRGDPTAELLVLFTGAADSTLAQEVASVDVPALAEFAAQENIALQVVDVSTGAPEEITITPMIAYLSPRGRALYQGRYRDLSRLRNFLQTFRVVDQPQAEYVRERGFLWRSGRAQVVGALKVTELNGTVPPGHNAVAFRGELRRGLTTGFEALADAQRISLRRGDRIFYVDVHPYAGPDGTLHLTIELYSQFHCKEPVYSNAGAPLSGRWMSRAQLFAEAGTLIERELLAQLSNPKRGDGFDAVPESIAVKGWEALPFPLPVATSVHAAVAVDLPLGRDWIVVSPATDRREDVIFTFAPPLEFYSGHAAETGGELHLPVESTAGGRRQGSGRIVVQTKSVSMGYPPLDESIRGRSTLAVARFPEASFEIRTIEQEGDLAFGAVTPVGLDGVFTMKGESIPLAVRAQLEPIVGDDGSANLLLSGRFELRLADAFGIEGPDGPAPARDTLLFDFLFRLRGSPSAPAEASAGVTVEASSTAAK